MQANIALPVRELHQVMFAESRREDRGERFGVSDSEPEGENGPNITDLVANSEMSFISLLHLL